MWAWSPLPAHPAACVDCLFLTSRRPSLQDGIACAHSVAELCLQRLCPAGAGSHMRRLPCLLQVGMRDPFLINSPGTREVQHEMGLLYDSTINEHWTKDGLWPTSANGSSRLWPCEHRRPLALSAANAAAALGQPAQPTVCNCCSIPGRSDTQAAWQAGSSNPALTQPYSNTQTAPSHRRLHGRWHPPDMRRYRP